MQEYKGQGIVLQGDTNNNNLFKASNSYKPLPLWSSALSLSLTLLAEVIAAPVSTLVFTHCAECIYMAAASP